MYLCWSSTVIINYYTLLQLLQGKLRLESALLAPNKFEDAEIVDERVDVVVAHD